MIAYICLYLSLMEAEVVQKSHAKIILSYKIPERRDALREILPECRRSS